MVKQITLSNSKDIRASKIKKLMELTWSSLESHLQDTFYQSSTKKKFQDEVGNKSFHKDCVREYAETIKLLSELY